MAELTAVGYEKLVPTVNWLLVLASGVVWESVPAVMMAGLEVLAAVVLLMPPLVIWGNAAPKLTPELTVSASWLPRRA